MAIAARRGHACGRLGARPGGRARDGASAARAAGGVRTPHRHSGAAEHVVQRRRRTDRHAAARRVLDVQALRTRPAGGRLDAGHETRGIAGQAAEGGRGMVVRKRGGFRRRLIVLGSAGGSIADLARGLWRRDSGKRWLVPLAVFLCIFGLVLILATTVEALAPVIYAIF